MSYQLGQSAGYEALARQESLIPLLHSAYNVAGTATGALMLSGLLEVASVALDSLQRSGNMPSIANDQAQQIATAAPMARRLLLTAALSRETNQASADILGALAHAIYLQGDKITVSQSTPDAPAPDVQRIEIVNIADTPTALHLISMPTRTTSTEIIRNAAGNIVESLQVERDA